MFEAQQLQRLHQAALTFDDYIATGTAEQRARWQKIYDSIDLTDDQRTLLDGFVRSMPILVISGIWCGDCVEQGPLLERMARACPVMQLRFIDRDILAETTPELIEAVKINDGKRVPVVLFMAEDFALCSWYGDRVRSRYGRIVEKLTGAACSTGLFVPEQRALADDLQCWLDECLRVQWLLRTSTRLRQLHND